MKKPKENLPLIDEEARKMMNWPRQSLMSQGTEKSMPRLIWKDGLTSMTALTAQKRLRVILTVTVADLLFAI